MLSAGSTISNICQECQNKLKLRIYSHHSQMSLKKDHLRLSLRNLRKLSKLQLKRHKKLPKKRVKLKNQSKASKRRNQNNNNRRVKKSRKKNKKLSHKRRSSNKNNQRNKSSNSKRDKNSNSRRKKLSLKSRKWTSELAKLSKCGPIKHLTSSTQRRLMLEIMILEQLHLACKSMFPLMT